MSPGTTRGVQRGRAAPVRAHAGRSRRRMAAAGPLVSLALAASSMAGCAEDVRATLVALRGCGLEGEQLSSLRIVPRGDFPGADANDVTVTGGRVVLDDAPGPTVAYTVEGRFEDFVEAVGRTARLDDDGALAVYFAPPDALCALDFGIGSRDLGGMAVGPRGDIVVAGGRDGNGRLLDAVISARDVAETVTPLPASLPDPTTGMVLVPTGERSFLAIGGARSDARPVATYTSIDLDAEPPIGTPAPVEIDGQGDARAYAASAVLPDGRVLVSGGCRRLDTGGSCTADDGSVLRSSYFVRLTDHGPVFTAAPPLIVARRDHELLVGRDGVVFAVGGRDDAGGGVITIERLVPGASKWTPYGRPANLALTSEQAIIGATLLEGGLVVVALDDGRVGWISDGDAGLWYDWCDGDPTTVGCFHDETAASVPRPARRRMLTLPDERVLADAWLLPVAMLSRTDANALDLSAPKLGGTAVPPPPRVGAEVALLADGTVLFAGGRNPDTLELVKPFAARFRPDLDGPDERMPPVESFGPGSFVSHVPSKAGEIERVSRTGDVLQLNSAELVKAFPAVWAHVRSFRSTSFRLDLTYEAHGAVAHVLLSQGAVRRTSIRFDATGVRRAYRDERGNVEENSCGPLDIDLTRAQSVRIDVRPGSIDVRVGETSIACPGGVGDVPIAVGVGASGSGTVELLAVRLTRA